jgi:putative DNA primase/helicase
MQHARPRTANEAVGRWPGILQALGIDGKHLRNKHGACPACGGKDRFRFDDKDGRGTWYCSHCGSGDGFGLLRQTFGWDFRRAAQEVDRIVGTVQAGAISKERSEESKLQALRAAWKSSRPVTKGDPVWLYLNRRVGIEVVPADIRLHPGMAHSDGGTYPVMLSTMRYPDGSAASIHRTYLTADGQKAPVVEVKKFMPGKPLQTASIRLGAAGERIGIAEGIETALAASRRFGVPVWAATNAVLLEAWTPPHGVKEVLIAGDNDPSYTGQSAAFALARRLVRDGYAVEIQIPTREGADWADEGI